MSRAGSDERDPVQSGEPLVPARTSERPKGETALLQRVLGDRLVLENLPEIVTVVDREQTILYLNRSVLGRRAEDLIGSNALDYIPVESRGGYTEAFERAWRTGQPTRVELSTTGGYCWQTRFIPVHEAGAVTFILCTSTDATDRVRYEAELRESASRLQHAIDVVGMGAWTHSFEDGSLVWDDALCVIHGVAPADAPRTYEEALARVHPEDRARVEASFRHGRLTGEYEELEHRIVRASGELRHVRVKCSWRLDKDGRPIGSIGATFDETGRKRMEEQLNQRQKMEAIGELTAGIAHNFNNVLSIILPNVELCKRDAPPLMAAQLGDVEHAARRAADLVRQLMLFARRDFDARKKAIDPISTLRRTVEICRTTFDRGIRLELAIGSSIPRVLANAGQIEQVLLNICINARDAFEDARTHGPTIAIRVDRTAAGAVRIRVTDNGPGMDEQTRSRVFEPFFTTKEIGRGTGLGLASVYAIVHDHAGRVACESRPGHGTSFEIELPGLPETAVESEPAAASPLTAGGTETVLIIDDEPMVRRATRAMLEHGGYRVLECGDGEQALRIFERKHAEIDLVVLDRSMPGLSGEQVFLRLKEIASDVPIVLLSGQPSGSVVAARAAAALIKPLGLETLLGTVRSVLDRKRTTTE